MRSLMILSVALAGCVLAACGGGDSKTSTPTPARSASGTAAGTATATATATATVSGSPAGASPFVVHAILKDYEVVRNPGSGEAGGFEFQISNTGPSTHQFVVVKTDLAADALPTNSDGVVKENELDKIGGIQGVAVGATETFTASLDAGHYVFFCNLVEQGGGGTIAHYIQGMHKDFTVQ